MPVCAKITIKPQSSILLYQVPSIVKFAILDTVTVFSTSLSRKGKLSTFSKSLTSMCLFTLSLTMCNNELTMWAKNGIEPIDMPTKCTLHATYHVTCD